MRGDELFPGKFLRASDLDGHEPVVTIERTELKQLGEQRKLVIYFKGKEKGFVVNRTNYTAIAEITGRPDTDDWPGQRIRLIVAKVDFQGRRVPAIRVEPPGKEF